VAFEVTTADYITRLVAPGLAVALMPSDYAPRLSGVVAVPIDPADAPSRVEYAVWSSVAPTPAASAFLALLGITEPGTVRAASR
jgi:DNA-binding transcriptional LysR family regulator